MLLEEVQQGVFAFLWLFWLLWLWGCLGDQGKKTEVSELVMNLMIPNVCFDCFVYLIVEETRQEGKYQLNDAYSTVLNIKRNKAYEETFCYDIPTTEPHIYEVIHTPQGSPTEHLYADITTTTFK